MSLLRSGSWLFAGSAALLAITLTNGWIDFGAPVDFVAGDIFTAAVADFDQDQKPDIAIGRWSKITLVLSSRASYTIPVPGSAIYPIAGDFDRDGKGDIVAYRPKGDSVIFLRGTGNGEFQPGAESGPVDNAIYAVAADFDGDSILDLAVAAQARHGARLYFLRGLGDGSFAPRATVGSWESPAPSGLVTGDLNADGKPDLALALEEPPSLELFLGAGNGVFQGVPSIPVSQPSGLKGLSLGDLTGDGRLDLAAAAPQLHLFPGNGDGTLGSPRVFASTQFLRPLASALADFDRDGDLDLVLGGDTVVPFENDGAGSLTSQSPVQMPGRSILAVDLDGDQVQDLIGCDTNSFGGRLNRGDGTFVTAPGFAPPPDENLRLVSAVRIDLVDVNGDGLRDLVVLLRTTSDYLGWLPARGEGDFDSFRLVANIDVRNVANGDFNGDGRLDFVLVREGPNSTGAWLRLLQRGDGRFTPDSGAFDPTPGSLSHTADLDRNGLPDVVILSRPNVYPRVAVSLLSRPGMPLEVRETVITNRPIEDTPYEFLLADFDNDAIPDLLVAGAGSQAYANLLFFRGLGDGTFAANSLESSPLEIVYGMDSGDFNRDGNLDVAVVSAGSIVFPSTVITFLGRGDGRFDRAFDLITPMPMAPNLHGGRLVYARDLDQDGILDLALLTPGLAALRGKGDGSFTGSSLSFGTNNWAQWADFADINGDGRVDAAVSGRGGFSLLFQSGSQSFPGRFLPAGFSSGPARLQSK